ncbi:MAG: hypothetical protein EBV64_12865 [Oxalobacteraceae bacterium]|nr:hypothetical protein [Oxalobacteraceae bacterium]
MRMQIVVFAKAKKRNYDLFCDFRQALRPGFFALSSRRLALSAISKEAEFCAVSRFSSSAASTPIAWSAADESLCASTKEPASMQCF